MAFAIDKTLLEQNNTSKWFKYKNDNYQKSFVDDELTGRRNLFSGFHLYLPYVSNPMLVPYVI